MIQSSVEFIFFFVVEMNTNISDKNNQITAQYIVLDVAELFNDTPDKNKCD